METCLGNCGATPFCSLSVTFYLGVVLVSFDRLLSWSGGRSSAECGVFLFRKHWLWSSCFFVFSMGF